MFQCHCKRRSFLQCSHLGFAWSLKFSKSGNFKWVNGSMGQFFHTWQQNLFKMEMPGQRQSGRDIISPPPPPFFFSRYEFQSKQIRIELIKSLIRYITIKTTYPWVSIGLRKKINFRIWKNSSETCSVNTFFIFSIISLFTF